MTVVKLKYGIISTWHFQLHHTLQNVLSTITPLATKYSLRIIRVKQKIHFCQFCPVKVRSRPCYVIYWLKYMIKRTNEPNFKKK